MLIFLLLFGGGVVSVVVMVRLCIVCLGAYACLLFVLVLASSVVSCDSSWDFVLVLRGVGGLLFWLAGGAGGGFSLLIDSGVPGWRFACLV